MKTGIIRRIDDLGRIILPKEIRKSLQIHEGDPLEISIEGDTICLDKYIPTTEYTRVLKRVAKEIDSDQYFDKNNSKDITDDIKSIITKIETYKKG